MDEKAPPAPRGILKDVTDKDRNLIDLPVLTPHFGYQMIEDGQVLLVSETFSTVLRGRIQCDLLPLLDGTHSQQDIVAALDGKHSPFDVQVALVSLASRGYVVSAEYAMDPGLAAFWTSLGASPRWAEERMGAASVAIAGDEDALAGRLADMGVQVAAADPTLSVIVCADYLDDAHVAVNHDHMRAGTPWMLVKPTGVQALFGPVFRPAQGGPCWVCLAYRLRGHDEVRNFLRNLAGNDAADLPAAAAPVYLDAVYGLVAGEIAKWLVLGDRAPVNMRAISLDVANLRSEHHPTMRRPQCRVCGDESLYRADRPARPVRLQSSPVTVRNSGGARSVSPEETLARYRHLVSPVSGVVTWLRRTSDEVDPWLHVHWAGSNVALRSRRLSSLRRSLRSKSAGKGSTPRQSEASALCEAIERYSCALHGDEIRCRRSYADFQQSGLAEALHPNDVQLFSERQLDNAEVINAGGHPYNTVPPRLDPDAEIDWSPVWSLTEERHRYLPTSMLYGMPAELRGGTDFIADSNGCAAGNTLEEAILQGFFELVERDAFAIWWYNRLRRPGLDLSSFDDDYLAAAPDYYRRLDRDMWVLDVTADFGIPVFVAVSRRTDKSAEDIIYGAGAHHDPHIAALRAVCEMNQFLNWVQGSAKGGAGYAVDDPLCLSWWQNAKLGDHDYLAPAPDTAQRVGADHSVAQTGDLREDVERCRTLVESKGMDFLVLDQTRPDIGMPVVRVIVPGMRHFWERFAPGRLYDIPVVMGCRGDPLAEADLNPAAVIA